MPEYIERGAVLAEMISRPLPNDASLLYFAMRGIVRKAPAADVVEVVRCKECNFFGKNRPYRDNKLPFSFCDKFHHNITTDDDFCSYGERKEGAEK